MGIYSLKPIARASVMTLWAWSVLAQASESLQPNIRYPINGDIVSTNVQPGQRPLVPGVRYRLFGSVNSSPQNVFGSPANAPWVLSKVPDISRPVVDTTAVQTASTNEAGTQSVRLRFLDRANAFFSTLDPTLGTEFRFRKVQYVNINEGRTEDQLLVALIPGASHTIDGRRWSLKNDYKYHAGRFFLDRHDSLTEHQLKTDYELLLGTRSGVKVSNAYRRTNDVLERNVVESIAVDHYSNRSDVTFRRGGSRDRVNFEVGIATVRNSYDSGGDVGRYTHTENGMSARADYKFRPRLSFDVRMDHKRFSYDDDTLDSTEQSVTIGANYTLNSRMTSRLNIGVVTKDFEAVDQRDTSAKWQALLTWRPFRDTMISFETSQRFVETYRLLTNVDPGNTALATTFAVRGSQTWGKLNAGASVARNQYEFRENGVDNTTLSFNLNYRFRQWMIVGLAARYRQQEIAGQRSSNEPQITLTLDINL